ncbi:Holliday junction branch migration protein RuvA [Methanocella conradii]|uniref:Holliday junction branch migration protein RuvA n=1 Tax=Methanocella conradii TaxID=1175444 RepID=UPI00157CD8CD|nr:Holliday junction branch migration protein RuvA [Methanocella conradii]
MIAHLEGRLDFKGPDRVVIDVGGVGYDVRVPTHLYDLLPNEGEMCKVYIHTHFREEDGISLYGFTTWEDREFFKLLMTVSGIGPKVALGIMSSITASDLAEAIVAEDAKALTRVSGVGKKMAQRLILELKDKVAEMAIVSHEKKQPADTVSEDATSALVALGYARQAAVAAVAKARESMPAPVKVEELIKISLRYL